MRVAAAAALAFTLSAAVAHARVTDPTALARFDSHFDIGAASPIGAVGGAAALNWRHFSLEGGIGWGFTGAHAMLMPKVPIARWGASNMLIGVGASLAVPVMWNDVAYRWTVWETAELQYQRVYHVDRTFNLGVGLTTGIFYSDNCSGRCKPRRVFWPSVRLGWGMRR